MTDIGHDTRHADRAPGGSTRCPDCSDGLGTPRPVSEQRIYRAVDAISL